MARTTEVANVGRESGLVVRQLDTSNQRGGYAVRLARDYVQLAQQDLIPDEVLSEGHIHDALAFPNSVCITQDTLAMEPFRSSANASSTRISSGAKDFDHTASGRVVDIYCQSWVDRTGGGNSHVRQRALVDSNFMPAHLGWEHDIALAQATGRFSKYWSLARDYEKIGKNEYKEVHVERDIFYLAVQQGDEYYIRSIIGGDAHTQDAMQMLAAPAENLDVIEFNPEEFLDFLSLDVLEERRLRGHAKQPGINRKLQNDMRKAEDPRHQYLYHQYIQLQAARLRDPGVNFNGLRDYHGKKLNQIAIALSETYYENIVHNKSRLSNAGHAFLRAGMMLDSTETYEKHHFLSRDGIKDLQAQRTMIIQSILAATAYMHLINKARKTDVQNKNLRQANAEEGEDISEKFGHSIRFTAISADDLDKNIVNMAERALRARNDEDYEAMLKGMVRFIKARKISQDDDPEEDYDTLDPDVKFAIRANGTNRLLPFTSLRTDAKPGAPSETIAYSGKGIPHGVHGHYAYEIPGTLLDPARHDGRYTETGLAMPGVVARFNVHTPDQEHEKHAPEQVRAIVLSGRHMPRCLQRAIHELTHGTGKNFNNVRDVLNGGFPVVATLEQTRVQSWNMVEYTPEGPVVDPQTLYNGMSVALVRDSELTERGTIRYGEIKTTYGTVGREGPLTRRIYGQPRPSSSGKAAPIPVYNDGTVSKLAPGANPNKALMEIIASGNSLYMTRLANPQKVNLEAHYTPNFINVDRV